MDNALSAWSDAGAWQAAGRAWLAYFGVEATRYVVLVAAVWAVLHVLLKRRLAHRLIGRWPSAPQQRREMAQSALTLLVFAALGMFVVAQVRAGHMEVYRDPARHGWAWLLASLPLMIVWHDAYFYWTHRWLHTPWMLRHVHGVHHRSRDPSPWAAYAFHPVEALVNGAVVPLALAVVPLHWSVLLLFSLHQVLRNAHGHAAVETMPRGFATHRLGRHFTTTTHHHLHHEAARGNYGLWFTWWDRACGTERADYRARFDRATRPRAATPPGRSPTRAGARLG